jgi:putative transposase
VNYLTEAHSLPKKQACILLSLNRSSYYYKAKQKDDTAVIEALRRLAEKHPFYGFRKMFNLIRREGYEWNHKKVYRVYRTLKMNLHRKMKRRLPTRIKTPLTVPTKPNEIWSMDFMSDSLQCGRRIRALNIMDDFNREALTVEVSTSIPAYAVVEQLNLLITERGKPQQIRVDNGPEFISNTFTNFCNEHNIEINYIQPGKPMQNGFIERFNRSYRTEILDAYLFKSLKEVDDMSQQWIVHYNQQRPHDSLNGLTPIEYKQKYL